MKIIEERRLFDVRPEDIWEIISDLSRCDWVPGVERITLKGSKRTFKMKGMGQLVEEIHKCDHHNLELEYSAVETMAPINHHLARIKLTKEGDKTVFLWTTQIDPEEFSDAIREGMVSSLDQLNLLFS
tara:strand:- start:5013 stop:5396 length:384 start_codon:yes stop_codon:yes gene_type:complete